MKKYNQPTAELFGLAVSDIIQTSPTDPFVQEPEGWRLGSTPDING